MSVIASQIDLCAEVAVPVPVKDPFTYRIPAEFAEKAKPGVRVRIPFKNRELIGYMVGVKESSHLPSLKPLLEILDEKPVISEALLALTQWIAGYYSSSWGESIENALPKSAK